MAQLFKIIYENELYLIRCTGPEFLPQIQAAASDRFRLPSLQDLVFFYRSTDGDRVFIAFEEDLALALENEKGPLRLKLVPRRAPTAPAAAPAPPSNVRHAAVCDGCAESIVGIRYKCGHCPDFDFCSKCYATQKHPEDHVFLVCSRPIGRHAQPLLPHLGPGRAPPINSLLTPQHACSLTLMTPYNGGQYICNGCGLAGFGPAYHCAVHKFDLHPRCARVQPGLRTNTVVPPVPGPAPTPAPVTSVVPPPTRPGLALRRLRFANSAPRVVPDAPAPAPAPAVAVAPVAPDLEPSEPAPTGRLLRLYPVAAPVEVEVPRVSTPKPVTHFSAPTEVPVVPVVAVPAPVFIPVPAPVPAVPAPVPVVAVPEPEPSAPAEPQQFEAELGTLLAMGFDRQVSELVLNLRNGDLDLCLADLLGN